LKTNIKQSTLEKNHYNNLSFWENEIIKDNNLWEGYFDNKPISKNSKIIYTGILDLNKNILQCGWAVYPCSYSLLGFLQHVYLPTAFFIWFDRKPNNVYIPISAFNAIVSETLKHNDSNTNLDAVNSMKNAYTFLDGLWNDTSNLLSLKLRNFCDTFNNTWDNHPNQKLFIKIFDHPCDTYDFVKDCLIYDTKDFVDEDISMALDTLKFACENAIDEPLLNNRFIDILNTNAPILF
jgi:hypothetical protein